MNWTNLFAWLEWFPQLSTSVTILVVATLGYFFGRRRTDTSAVGATLRSQREVRRAQAVASELELISEVIRKHLAKHQSTLNRFKQRVNRLGDEESDSAMRELFREAEEMLQPTMQFAGQIAHAYEQIRQQTNRLMSFTDARTDPLTGINNRRALDDALASHLALKSRYNLDFTLVLFDLDYFKQVNDERGHLFGDRVLQDVAQILEEEARETDTVVRYGGEEFTVVMPETDLEGACHFSERIREKIEQRLPVTISGGVTLVIDGDTAETVIARADAALYEAKNHGRNRMYRHDGVQLEPILEPVLESVAVESV